MTGRPVIGLLIALVVEARHWTRFRWDFDDDDCGRAWQFTCIAIALAAVLIWLDGSRYTALPGLLSWMPPLLLPMQFVQSYGMRDSLPLSMFSFLAKHRRERNLRLGLTEDTANFNFGNVLFGVTMVASTVGSKSDTWLFLPGIVILSGWILLAASHSRPFALIPVLLVAGLLALAGQFGLERAEEWIGRASNAYRGRFDPNFESTLIGSRGTVEQSPDIVWRLRPKEGTAPPALVRTATFNTFLGTNWQNQRVANTDFKDVDSRLIGEDPYYFLQTADQAKNLPELPSFTLRGAAAAESPLPLPGDAAGLRDFELDAIEVNSFGTVRVFPKQSVIDGTIFWKGGTNPELAPVMHEDLRIPLAETTASTPKGDETSDSPFDETGEPAAAKRRGGAIHDAVVNLQLDREPDLRGKLNRIRAWFHQEFRYTRNLTIQHPTLEERVDDVKDPTVLARFLTEVKAGHCEYFATAATLMLRDAGIPARYAKGFAVIERDAKRGEYVLRGTHGHAWCRVWDQDSGTWIDFDPTPPDWQIMALPQASAIQRFNDGLKRVREDFFIWRNRPSNRLAVSLSMFGIGLALTAFIVKRLWRSKRRLESKDPDFVYEGPVIRTPLHELEPQARKLLGYRPPGEPFSWWLARLRHALPDSPALDEAISLHQRLRYDPEPAPPGQRERLADLVRELESMLKNRSPEKRASP
jgi:hypothetical protein